MVLMLPTTTDNGARLAAILPTGIAALARGLGADPSEALGTALGAGAATAPSPESLPPIRSLILLVVDGLGHSNLREAKAHARTLAALPNRRIETVVPSTTGAALTTLTTGRLPGEHGLIGYRIRHPELGLVTTLKDWAHIADRAAWQRATPLFAQANALGVRTVAIGRPAHATGGLTEAILAGAEYSGGQTIDARFAIALRLARAGDPFLAYLYVDELDRAGHSEGWQSEQWLRRLEALDSAVARLLPALPADVGLVMTADHGMIDVGPERQVRIGRDALEGVAEVGGEARFRSFYLEPDARPAATAEALATSLGSTAWVGLREEAIDAGWFGPVHPSVAPRLGEVIAVARGGAALTLDTENSDVHAMIGQHGGLSDEERGVPLALGGGLAGTGFAAAVGETARRIAGGPAEG